MDFSELKVNYESIRGWMKFPIQLGQILKRYSNTNKTSFNIYISVPNSIVFSYFLFHGMFDVEANRKVRDTRIINRFLELKPGAVVYYDDEGVWRKCSVIDIKKNFTETHEYHLQIQLNKKASIYVPVNKWKDKFIITDIVHEEILNARIIKEFEKFSGVLSSLYSPKTIKALELLNEPTAYFSGNKTEFERYLSYIRLEYKTIDYTFKDVVLLNSKNHFSNAKWITSKNNSLKLNATDWLVSIGAGKSLNNLNLYKRCGNIFIEDQFENVVATETLRDEIMQKIILENGQIITNNLLTMLEKENVIIPNGVHIIAWK